MRNPIRAGRRSGQSTCAVLRGVDAESTKPRPCAARGEHRLRTPSAGIRGDPLGCVIVITRFVHQPDALARVSLQPLLAYASGQYSLQSNDSFRGPIMPELRKDPIVGRWVIIAPDRAKRPIALKSEAAAPSGAF